MKRQILDYAGIVIGCFIVSVAFVIFINPYKLVPGGVFGTSIVLHSLFPSIQVGTFGYMISIPLLIMSYLFLGKNIGIKTLVATLVTPFLMNLLSTLTYPDTESLQRLDPSKLCGGYLDLSNDLILAAVLGPILIGVGEGIIFRCNATSGGSDIVAMLFRKYCHVKFSKALIATDGAVVLFGLLVIGMGIGTESPSEHSWRLSGYSLICIYITSQTISYVISGSKNTKLLFIVTEAGSKQMQEFILKRLDRTATVLKSHGLYTQKNKDTLMMVVRQHEVDIITKCISEIDPNVFVIVNDCYDIYGYRWKDFPDKSTLTVN